MAALFFIYTFVFLLNFTMLIIKRNSIIVAILSALGIILLMAGNSSNPDYHNYSGWFAQSWYPASVENGYILLADFFLKVGFTYNQFLIAVFFLCGSIIGLILYKLNANYHIFILMFICYQMFFDYVQIRCTIAVLLLTLSVFFQSLRRYKLSIIVMIVAVQFHISVVLYLPFIILLYCLKEKKQITFFRLYFIFILFFCMCVFVCGNRIPMLDYLKSHGIVSVSKFNKYFTTRTHLGFIFPFILQFYNVFMAILSDKIIKTYSQNRGLQEGILLKTSADKYAVIFSTSVKYIVLYSCFALPLVMMNEEFIRYFRNCNLMIYIQTATTFLCNNKRKSVRISSKIYISFGAYLFVTIGNVISWILLYSPSNIVLNLFENNVFV